MKNKSSVIFTLLFMFFISINNSFSQQLNPKIQEVFGDKTQELVISDIERLNFLTDLIENRIKIIESPITENEKYEKLSSVALFNKYNNTLTRDVVFNPNNFNALKYDLKFSSKNTEVYRFDNTDFLIVIQPQILK